MPQCDGKKGLLHSWVHWHFLSREKEDGFSSASGDNINAKITVSTEQRGWVGYPRGLALSGGCWEFFTVVNMVVALVELDDFKGLLQTYWLCDFTTKSGTVDFTALPYRDEQLCFGLLDTISAISCDENLTPASWKQRGLSVFSCLPQLIHSFSTTRK